MEHAGIGVQLLWQLVSEMNQLSDSDATLTLTKHRKIASSFRDVHLYEIFQLSCTLLRNTLENFRNMNFEDQGKVRFRSQNFYNIFLLLNCFLLTLLSIICWTNCCAWPIIASPTILLALRLTNRQTIWPPFKCPLNGGLLYLIQQHFSFFLICTMPCLHLFHQWYAIRTVINS